MWGGNRRRPTITTRRSAKQGSSNNQRMMNRPRLSVDKRSYVYENRVPDAASLCGTALVLGLGRCCPHRSRGLGVPYAFVYEWRGGNLTSWHETGDRWRRAGQVQAEGRCSSTTTCQRRRLVPAETSPCEGHRTGAFVWNGESARGSARGRHASCAGGRSGPRPVGDPPGDYAPGAYGRFDFGSEGGSSWLPRPRAWVTATPASSQKL